MTLKKFVTILFLFVFMALSMMKVEAANKPIVAVFPFTNQSARASGTGTEALLKKIGFYVENVLKNKHGNRFRVMTRAQYESALQSIEFDHSGLVDPNTAAQYGKMIGAQYIVLGTVTELGKKGSETFADLSLRMIEVETAEIYLSGYGEGKSKTDESDALMKATKDALNGDMGMLSMLSDRK